jgi:hypothetical protein
VLRKSAQLTALHCTLQVVSVCRTDDVPLLLCSDRSLAEEEEEERERKIERQGPAADWTHTGAN